MNRALRLLDSVLLTLLSLGVVGGFLWLSFLLIANGNSNADDAWMALSAKNLALGKGYATSKSSTELVQFDPFISTGPSLILPAAMLIYIFGPVVWMPGAVQLVVFVGQLFIVTLVWARRAGWVRSLAYVSVTLFLICLASPHNWYFGALLGEPVAFGFIVIGAALLAISEDRWNVLCGAGCFGLAWLTKQISVFSVAGIVFAWLALNIYDRTRPSILARRFGLLLLAGASLPVAFEAMKLVVIGFKNYSAYLETIFAYGLTAPPGANAIDDRWTSFLSTISSIYLPLPLICGLAVGSWILIVRLAPRDEAGDFVARFVVLGWSGAAAHTLYFAAYSTQRFRYLWVGFALLLAAVASPMLLLACRGRIAVMASILAATPLFGLLKPHYPLYGLLTRAPIARERSAVVTILDSNPDLPYAAQWWASIDDIVYPRAHEGTWMVEPRVNDLRGQDFIAIVNMTFTQKESAFYTATTGSCQLLTKEAKRILAYRCSRSFWEVYRKQK